MGVPTPEPEHSTAGVRLDPTAAFAQMRSDGDGVATVGEDRSVPARVSQAPRPWLARRLVAAADAERKRIENDLHDGLQQRLTSLRIRLSLAAAHSHASGEDETGAILEGFGEEVESAIAEVRDLARGIYPVLLTSDGLGAALTAAGTRAAQPVAVSANVRRCRPEVEVAVYFVCLEAMDNAAKHAAPAGVSVRLTDTDGTLRFTVSDSGPGFEPNRARPGTGIERMRDRLTAIGGVLSVDSAPARGTRVTGDVPDAWLQTGDV